MRLSSTSLTHGAPVPEHLAFCRIHPTEPAEHVSMAENRSPHLAWSDVPAGTRSLVIIVHDPDVPSAGDDVNKEGRTVPADLPRVDFYHWVAVDLDPAMGEITEGAFSDGITARGKGGPDGPHGTRQGRNDYTGWFAGDPDMEGEYHGYDGPCPPWNDELLHHYHHTVYATDLDRVPVSGSFDAPAVREAISGHILDQAEIVGTYTLNPAVAGAAKAPAPRAPQPGAPEVLPAAE